MNLLITERLTISLLNTLIPSHLGLRHLMQHHIQNHPDTPITRPDDRRAGSL